MPFTIENFLAIVPFEPFNHSTLAEFVKKHDNMSVSDFYEFLQLLRGYLITNCRWEPDQIREAVACWIDTKSLSSHNNDGWVTERLRDELYQWHWYDKECNDPLEKYDTEDHKWFDAFYPEFIRRDLTLVDFLKIVPKTTFSTSTLASFVKKHEELPESDFFKFLHFLKCYLIVNQGWNYTALRAAIPTWVQAKPVKKLWHQGSGLLLNELNGWRYFNKPAEIENKAYIEEVKYRTAQYPEFVHRD